MEYCHFATKIAAWKSVFILTDSKTNTEFLASASNGLFALKAPQNFAVPEYIHVSDGNFVVAFS